MLLTQDIVNKIHSFSQSRRVKKQYYTERKIFNREIKDTVRELKEELIGE